MAFRNVPFYTFIDCCKLNENFVARLHENRGNHVIEKAPGHGARAGLPVLEVPAGRIDNRPRNARRSELL